MGRGVRKSWTVEFHGGSEGWYRVVQNGVGRWVPCDRAIGDVWALVTGLPAPKRRRRVAVAECRVCRRREELARRVGLGSD